MKEERERVVKDIMKLLSLPEKEREKVLRIVSSYPVGKIRRALSNVILYTKHGKQRVNVTLEEFEEIVRKTRF